MYLSRIELNAKRQETRRAIASPQVMHAAVENCFPDRNDREERNLWRLDGLYDRLYLLLLSPQKPDFEKFSAQFCNHGETGETKNYDPLLDRIQAGQLWRFRLRGNATHNSTEGKEEKSERGKIYSHIKVEYQRKWLLKQAPLCGFTLDERLFDVSQAEHLRFWRDRKKPPITLGVTVFEGELAVADSELFKQALTRGIGRAKAYGCGLLTIVSPKNLTASKLT